jgi:hypothetical protein
LAHQFVEQVDRQVAVGLEVFHRLLARAQAGDLLLQGGDLLDLHLELLDLAAQQGVLALLRRDLGLEPQEDGAGDDAAEQGRDAQRGEERLAPALARRLAVGQQVDQDHCRNLRMARPQDVR